VLFAGCSIFLLRKWIISRSQGYPLSLPRRPRDPPRPFPRRLALHVLPSGVLKDSLFPRTSEESLLLFSFFPAYVCVYLFFKARPLNPWPSDEVRSSRPEEMRWDPMPSSFLISEISYSILIIIPLLFV